ncbi:MAG: branched-chain amino acid ABC transporter permease [Holophaga sp.]|jgi:branched-chain amino acid transport system permease protein
MGYIQLVLILGGIGLIATLGVAILTGYTGLFSIGHAGFMALGGYAAAILVKEFHVPMLLAILAGGAFAGLCSPIIGYPAFRSRLRGDYFAIATLGFAEAVRIVLNNVRTIGSIELGGAFGYMDLPTLDTLGWIPPWATVTVAALVCLYFSHQFVTSQRGKNCFAVGQDEVAAEMMGVDLLRTKLLALFVSACLAGIAGALLGFYFGYLSPSFFTLTRSSDLLAGVVFGGMQSLIGPTITSLILIVVPQLLLQFAEYRLIVYGLLFVIVMIFRPQGLFGHVEMNLGFLRRLWKPARATGK